MQDRLSIADFIAKRAATSPDALAILGLDRAALSYAGMQQQLCQTVAVLNSMGIGRNDRVAIVLPNGPEMAVAFLGVAACATSAPLNPAYRAQEFDFYLEDLNAKAVIVAAGVDSPVRDTATARGIPLLELTPDPTTAGLFTLAGAPAQPTAPTGFAECDDIALILHTSGTTSRPKMVPLTQRNILRSAHNIGTTLALSPADRCLNVMPLFHIHGLMAALLSSLVAGGSVVCTPGFDAARVFPWLKEHQPTWYTAVPTMHQAILARAAVETLHEGDVKLRFARSSSSSLPPTVMTALEALFAAPVIEAYGMTEAAHQMASNPLPPCARKPGSVGMAAGPEVAIMAEDHDTVLATGETGEVVIRGENVTAGYLNNAEANAKSFVDGWFRTGDQGYLDEEGYLYLTGRLKEIINRGGEKIAPREVDEILLQHPAVVQAVTFAMPDATLGEEVAAAVILRESHVTEYDLRHFVAAHLADFKIPRRIVILDEIPKGPTGKLQRIGLAATLRLTADERPVPTEPVPFIAPRTQTERQLVNRWCDILKLETVSVQQPFLAVGGNSLAATQLVADIQKELALHLSVVDFFDAPTIAEQAKIIDERMAASPDVMPVQPLLRQIQRGNPELPALFFVPGGGGGEPEFLIYARLLHLLGREQPIYGFFSRGTDGHQPPHATVETLVDDYLAALRAVQPHGPYLLAGECIGGKVVLTMAQRLQAAGATVAGLLLLNTQLVSRDSDWQRPASPTSASHKVDRVQAHWAALRRRSLPQQARYLWQRWQHSRFNPLRRLQPVYQRSRRSNQARAHYHQLLRRYLPESTAVGPITLLVSEDYYQQDPTMGFGPWCEEGLTICPVPGDLHSYLGDHVQTTAAQMVQWLQAHRQPK